MGHYKEGKKESCFSRQRRWGFGYTVWVSTVLWPVPHMFYDFSGTIRGTDACTATTGRLQTRCNILQSVPASASCCCCCGRRMCLLFHTTFTITESICLHRKSSQKSTSIRKIKGSIFPIAIFAICVKILKLFFEKMHSVYNGLFPTGLTSMYSIHYGESNARAWTHPSIKCHRDLIGNALASTSFPRVSKPWDRRVVHWQVDKTP